MLVEVAELAAIPPPEGKRVTLRVSVAGRTLTAEIASKSLRRAQVAIREVGADNLALVLQGRLIPGDAIAEAGLSAQPRTITAANAMTCSKHGGSDDPPHNRA